MTLFSSSFTLFAEAVDDMLSSHSHKVRTRQPASRSKRAFSLSLR